MSDYTVRLDRVFHGPMDLLLHLVREQEVEIHEIEIHRVVDGYLAYLGQLESLDIEFAGEFVVMAATLMAIKSRSLLPHEEVDLEEELDPRDELIQRLIEYRRFREASDGLAARFAERQSMHGRAWKSELRETEETPTFDLGELTAFDLLGEYSRLRRETNANRPHRVTLEHRPLRLYVEDIVGRLKRAPRATLDELIGEMEGGGSRENVIGSFCALLELVQLGLVHVEQPDPRGAIDVTIRSEHVADIDDVVRTSGFSDEAPDEAPEEASEAPADTADDPSRN